MRRTAVLASGWVAATVLAVAVAWQGVGFVSREVTDRRPAALSAAEVQAELAARDNPTSSDSSTTTSPSNPGQPGSPTTQSSSGTPTSTPAQPTATTAPRSPTTSSRATPATTPTTAGNPPPSTTTTAPATAPETRTYNTVGGTATIRFEPGRVSLVSATPKAGFDAKVEQFVANELSVRFRSDTHESRIDAKWDGGPRADIEERPR